MAQKMSVGATHQAKLFSLDDTRYDLSTYVGRCRHFFGVFNPLLTFTTDEELQEARNLLDRYQRNEITETQLIADPELNESLWNSKKLIDSSIHPQTDEKIFLPFRLCAFAPMNLPIATGMLTSTTQFGGLFWQWYNQSYNVCINFANGNKTNPMPPSKIAKAYTIAVLSSCGVHYGLNQFLVRSSGVFGSTMRGILAKTIPYTAVATAGSLNCVFMRYNEIEQGIQVTNAKGDEIGISRIAGKYAIAQTVASRIFLPVPILLLPPMIIKAAESTAFMQARPKLGLPLNLSVITVCLLGALPMAIGLFPQQSSILGTKLEPEFHNGEEILYFNKGL